MSQVLLIDGEAGARQRVVEQLARLSFNGKCSPSTIFSNTLDATGEDIELLELCWAAVCAIVGIAEVQCIYGTVSVSLAVASNAPNAVFVLEGPPFEPVRVLESV